MRLARNHGFLDVFRGVGVHARPHPGPLPQGEGEIFTSLDNFSIFIAVTDSVSFAVKCMTTQVYRMAQNAANNSPSPGGEGRGEGGCITDFVAVPEESYIHIMLPT